MHTQLKEFSWLSAQRSFTAYIRNPKQPVKFKAAHADRMRIYRRLVYNNINHMVCSAFPILCYVLSPQRWQGLIEGFIKDYHAQTPLFYEIPKEFVAYLYGLEQLPQVIVELAHFEWFELALELDATPFDETPAIHDGDWLTAAIVVSPLAHLLQYHYPVHSIQAPQDLVSIKAKQTNIVAYRKCNFQVEFMVLNLAAARLLDILFKRPGIIGATLIEQLIDEMQHPQPEVVRQGGLCLLQQLSDADIILSDN